MTRSIKWYQRHQVPLWITFIIGLITTLIGAFASNFFSEYFGNKITGCPSTVPEIVCRKSFVNVQKQWPTILKPLEHFLAEPRLLTKSMKATLVLEIIDKNKAVFRYNVKSELANLFDHQITETVDIKGDENLTPVKITISNANGWLLKNLDPENTIGANGNPTRHFITKVTIPPHTVYKVEKEYVFTVEKTGEYNMVLDRPLLGNFTINYSISKNIPMNFVLFIWKNGYDLALAQQKLSKPGTSATTTMYGPLVSGHGFVAYWKEKS